MANRIGGVALKAALPITCAKQLAASGFSNATGSVSFSGKTAYAIWKRSNKRNYDYGKCAWEDNLSISYRVNYPAIADTALFTRAEADLIAAYTLHETGHILFTDNSDQQRGREWRQKAEWLCRDAGLARDIVHPIANGLEDGRMERAVISAGIARNARQLFRKLLNKLTVEITTKPFNPCKFSDAAFTAAMLSREAFGNGNLTTATLLQAIPDRKRALYQILVDECATAPDGYDPTNWAYRTAIKFVLAWQALEPIKPAEVIKVNLPTEDKEEQDDEFGGLEDEDHDEEFDEFEDESEEDPVIVNENEEPEEGFGSSEDDSDEDGDSDDSGDESDDESDDEEPDESDDESGGTESSDDESDDESGEGSDEVGMSGDDEADEEDASEDSDAAQSAGGQQSYVDQDSNADAAPRDAEPDIDSIVKQANKRADEKTSILRSVPPAPVYDPMEEFMRRAHDFNDKPYVHQKDLL